MYISNHLSGSSGTLIKTEMQTQAYKALEKDSFIVTKIVQGKYVLKLRLSGLLVTFPTLLIHFIFHLYNIILCVSLV